MFSVPIRGNKSCYTSALIDTTSQLWNFNWHISQLSQYYIGRFEPILHWNIEIQWARWANTTLQNWNFNGHAGRFEPIQHWNIEISMGTLVDLSQHYIGTLKFQWARWSIWANTALEVSVPSGHSTFSSFTSPKFWIFYCIFSFQVIYVDWNISYRHILQIHSLLIAWNLISQIFCPEFSFQPFSSNFAALMYPRSRIEMGASRTHSNTISQFVQVCIPSCTVISHTYHDKWKSPPQFS